MVPKPNLPRASARQEALTRHSVSEPDNDSRDSLEYTPPKVAANLEAELGLKTWSSGLHETSNFGSKPHEVFEPITMRVHQPIVHGGLDLSHHGIHGPLDGGVLSMNIRKESDMPKVFRLDKDHHFENHHLKPDRDKIGKSLSGKATHLGKPDVIKFIEEITKNHKAIPKEPDLIFVKEIEEPETTMNPSIENESSPRPPVVSDRDISHKAQVKIKMPVNPPTPTASSIISTTNKSKLKPQNIPKAPEQPRKVPASESGILLIPGHEPESPADLDLIHHERSLDSLKDTGIIVRDDSSIISSEGATALILAGTCSLLLVFICFIMFVKKIKKQRIQKKVGLHDEEETFEKKINTSLNNPFYDSMNPRPPLDLLQVLAQPHHHSSLTASPGGTIRSQQFQQLKSELSIASYLALQSGPEDSKIGRIWFSLFYSNEDSLLHLHVLHSRYSKGRGLASNPGEVWIEISILSSMNKLKAQNKTDKRKATQSPVFNQKFTFPMSADTIEHYILRMSLIDQNPNRGTSSVGSVILPLNSINLNSTSTISRDLQ